MIDSEPHGRLADAATSTPNALERYTWFEHRHRFSVWAAARAAQRGFTSVKLLREALESANIQAVLQRPESVDADASAFESWHRTWCRGICRYIAQRGVTGGTYGRAAKLVAIYLKAMVVIGPDHDSTLSGVIHPPIDRLLLQNLASAPNVEAQLRTKWRTVNWTALNEDEYYALLGEMRTALGPGDPWWMLERYWTVSSGA